MTVLVGSSTFRSFLGTGTPDNTTYFRGDGTWQSAISATDLTTSNDLTFTGTGNRILGDFNTSIITDRPFFQSSVTNGNTNVGVIPNGTSNIARFLLSNNSNPTNSSILLFGTTASSVVMNSTVAGTGTLMPFIIQMGGDQAIQIDTNRNVIFNSAALATTATSGFPWIPSCAGTPTGAPTAPYTNAAAMVADTTNNRLYVLIGATWKFAALT